MRAHQLTLASILITHKHYDHTDGIAELLSVFSDVTVVSSSQKNIVATTQVVVDQEMIKIDNQACQIIAIPGHTLEHIAYYCKPFLFCGDTLFTNGCGRVFEGTAAQMLDSLKKLMALPDETQIYCGHEYTLSNIEFALQVEPDNIALQTRYADAKKLRSENKPTVPSTLVLEKATNPFLRCTEQTVINAVSQHVGKKLYDEVAVFSALRAWKNRF